MHGKLRSDRLFVVVQPAYTVVEVFEDSIRFDNSGSVFLIRLGAVQVYITHFERRQFVGLCPPQLDSACKAEWNSGF
jgi:hypothetical protein